MDTVVNSRGRALINLLDQYQLLLLNGTTRGSEGATSFGNNRADREAQSVVDYTLSSCTAA